MIHLLNNDLVKLYEISNLYDIFFCHKYTYICLTFLINN